MPDREPDNRALTEPIRSTDGHEPKRVVVVVGAMGKLPYAGMTYYWLHHVRGLQELGYQVHYVERQDGPLEYYDPSTDTMTDDVSVAVAYLAALDVAFGAAPDRFTLIDGQSRTHGGSYGALLADLEAADALISVSSPTWFGDLARCGTRIFIDGDPMFTQAAALAGEPRRTAVLANYQHLFSYGTRIGEPGCAIPDCGYSWSPARPVVATSLWSVTQPSSALPLTALLHWKAQGSVEVDGVLYGDKDTAFVPLMTLPSRVSRGVTLAVGGSRAPRAELEAHGWQLVEPLQATADAASYVRFIQGSYADVGVAKHAYTASRSGWFSDRATCFLAAGRPVLHQDTGFGDWLPEGPGVIPFTTIEELTQAVELLESDYETHARGARLMAEQQFEARVVLSDILASAGVRT